MKLRSLLVALAVLFATRAASADARAELEKARASFVARNWTDAEERLRTLLDPRTGTLKERPLISQARMYLGATQLALGKKDEAKESFEKLVLDDPTFEPDPLSFPGEAINTFIDVRSSLLEQIKTASQNAARLAEEKRAREEAEREAQRIWLERVKAQAAEEKITVRNSRIVASLPFGAGQFQNGQLVLGGVVLGAQAASVGGTIVTYAMYRYARGRENEELAGDLGLAPQWHQRAEDLRIANLAFAGSFLGTAALGILQAHLSFVPERAQKKPRDLPPLEPVRPRAALVPTVSILPGSGIFFGVQGVAF
jgi:tetratricopeptide (TPR) repeat protein